MTALNGRANGAAPPVTGELTPVVEAIGALHFEGNIVPHTWYQHPLLRHEDGKANLVAITLLSDICYWYRPTVLRDELTGRVISVAKKFGGDRLHWDHAQRATHFGLTKRQVQDAVAFLKRGGLIAVELREKWELASGAVLYNAVFVEPIPEVIRDLCALSAPGGATFSGLGATSAAGEGGSGGGGSIPLASAATVAAAKAAPPPKDAQTPSRLNGTPIPFKRDTPHVITGHPPRLNGTPPTFKREPQTEISTEISTKTSTKSLRNTAAAAPTESQGALPLTAAGESSGASAAAASARGGEGDALVEALVADLVREGMNRADAVRLARQSPDECRRQLGYLPYVDGFTSSKGAYLRSAIEQGFAPPKGFTAARKREASARKKAEAVQTVRAEQQRQDQAGAALEAAKAELRRGQPDLWRQILAEAEARMPVLLRGKPDHIAYGPTLEARVNEIVAARQQGA